MAIEDFMTDKTNIVGLPGGLSYDKPQESVFGIRIGSLGFLIPVSLYCEILDKAKVSPLPKVHPWLSGLLNLRGNLVPVFDMHKVLAESPIDQRNRRLFSIDRGEKAVALWIDGLPEIKDRSNLVVRQESSMLPDLLHRHVIQAYEQNGQVWLSVKFEAFFQTLGHYQYTAQR